HMTVSGLFLMREVAHCDTLEALVEISREIPVLQAQLVRAGANGLQVGEALSALWDAVTRRLIQLALKQMGPAPAPFAWLAVGSLARREIMAHADQDNALLYADRVESERDRQWFLTLGRYVTHGLAECGLTLCPGDVMARTPEWCQPLSVWKGYFDDWIGHPEPKSVMLTCNFFDARIVYGDELLFANLQTHALNKAQGNSIYLAHLAANATHHRPPLGFFRQFVLIDEGDHAQTLDIKQGGVMPIVELARVHAVASGSTAVHTLKRLQAGAAGGMLSDDMLRDLSMAYELIVTLRARHQAEQIGRGEAPDNYLSPGAIGQLDRSYLKQAFALIKTAQDSLAMRYQTERLR
ncbi:MAG: putative nucleotidyltransferase substrate binding domain-containing protein, partial [Gammaproteobacteria bacterium]